ncbi:MAG TPA: monofunctional biosynthetic peptidoglycan transglycosylase [bacterium]|nr:monofunctional biosynthetic peptidoglycan transglycosylase [bacterium]
MGRKLFCVKAMVKRLAGWMLKGFLLALFGPVVLILPLRFIDPPTTAFMLIRAGERAWARTWPPYPHRDLLRLAAISTNLQRAAIASEDGQFYVHHGFDLKQIENAWRVYERGGRLRGASTISQQTVKNLFLCEGGGFVRKGIEAYLTVYLELLLPKDRILELYLNIAEWGPGIFGAEAGAQYWFKKPAAKLTAAEAARLAAILPNPNRINPHHSYARSRVGFVTARMNSIVFPRRR